MNLRPVNSRLLLVTALTCAALARIVLAQTLLPVHVSAGPAGTPQPVTAVSHAIFPTQSLPIRFNHGRHMALGGVTCVRCHGGATTSDRAEDVLLPGEAVCATCHSIHRDEPFRDATPVARCDGCHEGWDPRSPTVVTRVDLPAPHLHFSHRVHVTRGQSCESCHGDLRTTGLATRLDLPAMPSCVGCHRPGGAPAACATCHLATPGGLLQTRFPEGWLNPPTWMRGLHHDADFWVTHRAAAAQDSSRCEPCHHESDCTDCHDGRVRDRRTHPNDYLTLHPADARFDSNRCGACHRAATFCVACHDRAGVAQTSAPGARTLGRVHPPPEVWVAGPVTSRHHGAEARRSLASCVSCHAEQDCVTCHATRGVGGGGFSPHPPGFASRCGALLRASDRPCRVCHEDMATVAARCR